MTNRNMIMEIIKPIFLAGFGRIIGNKNPKIKDGINSRIKNIEVPRMRVF
jgi:hypothetical protein